jgi:DNA-binding NtrC family response regulator
MRPRTSATDLVQLLDRAGAPVYVLDDERRIIFINRAAEQWTGYDQASLLGQECRYHSSAEVTGAAAVAAALCPPPESLAGRCVRALVSLPGNEAAGAHAPRQVDFVPLPDDDRQVVGVAAFVLPASACDSRERDEDDEPTAAELHERIRRYRSEWAGRFSADRLVGDSPAMQQVRNQVALAGQSTASVLLVGPTGSGRQHVARAVHYGRDPQGAGALVPLACPMLGAALLQTTLRALGREGGAGESARPASLLLVDVERMPPEAQDELALRLPRFGAPLRVVSTTAQPLEPLAATGRFRADLAGLLATLTISLPPLAARLQDLPLLAQMFLEDSNAQGTRQLAGFTPEALDALADYAWPGNVDELAEVVLQAHAQAEGPLVAPRDLPKRLHLAAAALRYPRKAEESIVLEELLARVERELIERAMSQAKGNKTKAARLLGMTRPRLYRRLVQLGLDEEGDDG